MVNMRKAIILTVCVLFVAVLLPAVLHGEDVIAYIGEVGGQVTVIKANPGEQVKAKTGMFLGAGDTIKTGDESFTSIIFQDDGSRIKLGPVAMLTVNATRKQKQLDKKMFLESGKLWAKVTKKRGTDVQIKTPTSVASVKGTKFILEEIEWGETWLWVLEDVVQLSNEKGTWNITQGQKGKATREDISVESLDIKDLPIEPGKHEIVVYFEQSGDLSLQRELHIELER